MRILIKGGVWKNTEDEILKAAVMKYGKNQWARVASLLNRKSAKQCKARWYEWLDPSIKKIEFSREEEEKLLHLAKLMPNQWRTIAPIVGRTAGQCMEHYERLLDQAQESAMATSSSSSSSSAAGGIDDPRRLRPGEIDPAPESKPARPDPIDMDEDEKEMLAEARARLANTKGKKAKRKARERQMDEARRLASIQKRRELKAAGIESKLGGRGTKRKSIDYTKEIPFQKVVPAGFYDVEEENMVAKSAVLDIKKHVMEISKMEGRHAKEEEDREQQKDKKRLKSLFKMNAPEVIAKISSANDPTALRQRVALSLPTPQVSDSELEDIVKANSSLALTAATAGLMLPPPRMSTGSKVGGNATASLVGDYSNSHYLSLPAPIRTPQQENIVMQEAYNARILRDMTPLMSSQLDESEYGQDGMTNGLIPELKAGTGFDGVNPRSSKIATPNMLVSTTASVGGASMSSAPIMQSAAGGRTVFGGSVSAGMMALRDQLGLNAPTSVVGETAQDSDNFSVSDVSSIGIGAPNYASRHREREVKLALTRQLQSLPEPEYVYEIAIPSVEAANEGDVDEIGPVGTYKDVIDKADEEESQRLAMLEQERLIESRRSSALKRKLPRPFDFDCDLARDAIARSSSNNTHGSIVSQLIAEETVRLLRHDQAMYPAEKSGKQNAGSIASQLVESSVDLETIPDEYLHAARGEIERECDRNGTSSEQFNPLWEDAFNSFIYSSRAESFVPVASVASQETLDSLVMEFSVLRAKADKDAKKAAKQEARVELLTKGYQLRCKLLESSLQSQFARHSSLLTDLTCFQILSQREALAIMSRLERTRREMNAAEALEAAQQQKYATLLKEVQELRQVH